MLVQISKPTGRKSESKTTKEELLDRLSDRKIDYRLSEQSQSMFHVCDNLQGNNFHNNYLEYLENAWVNHYGVVITPDILWYTLLSELVQIVGTDPEKYHFLFSETEKKQEIIVVSLSLTTLPLGAVIHTLRKLVPTDVDLFLPEFTTSTDRCRLARYAAFADLVSPYYNYMIMGCGIPYIDIRGTKEDYKKISSCWKLLAGIFNSNEGYFAKVQEILDNLISKINESDFWKEMFKSEKCGSGSQVEVFGWFADLFLNQPKYTRFVSNFSTHVAKVRYRQLDTKIDYEMMHGLFSNNLEDDLSVPQFSYIIYEKKKEPIRTEYKREMIKTKIYNL